MSLTAPKKAAAFFQGRHFLGAGAPKVGKREREGAGAWFEDVSKGKNPCIWIETPCS